MHLGKDGPVDSSGEFIRTSLSEEVYLTETSIKTYFIRDINYWSNLRILPQDLESASISSVKITSNIKLDNAAIDLNFHIKKETSGNTVEWKNMIVDKAVDRNRAELLISNIVSLTGDSFTEDKISKPDSRIEIETEKSGKIIIEGMMINDDEFLFGIQGSDLKYKISILKIERIFDSINNIYAEAN